MKDAIRTAAGHPALAVAAMTLILSGQAQSQARPTDIEGLVKYAQCIRANGYPEFPDPSPDGRMQLRLDPKAGGRLEAAQRACKDKMPAGMPGADQTVTPQRMQALLGFAQCMRKRGVREFPDPSPGGIFEIRDGAPELSAPHVKQALEACTESNPPGGLSIRRTQAR